jgi:hypothetical protein
MMGLGKHPPALQISLSLIPFRRAMHTDLIVGLVSLEWRERLFNPLLRNHEHL